jgi:pyruvate/oxaloacetate carboxyltransferase
VLNIVTGKRYGTVPDEVVQYAAGFYGKTVAPIDPDVLDRIMEILKCTHAAAPPWRRQYAAAFLPTIHPIRALWLSRGDGVPRP